MNPARSLLAASLKETLGQSAPANAAVMDAAASWLRAHIHPSSEEEGVQRERGKRDGNVSIQRERARSGARGKISLSALRSEINKRHELMNDGANTSSNSPPITSLLDTHPHSLCLFIYLNKAAWGQGGEEAMHGMESQGSRRSI